MRWPKHTPGAEEIADKVQDAPELDQLEWLNIIKNGNGEFIDENDNELEHEMELVARDFINEN
jgi:hypothetical protein